MQIKLYSVFYELKRKRLSLLFFHLYLSEAKGIKKCKKFRYQTMFCINILVKWMWLTMKASTTVWYSKSLLPSLPVKHLIRYSSINWKDKLTDSIEFGLDRGVKHSLPEDKHFLARKWNKKCGKRPPR